MPDQLAPLFAAAPAGQSQAATYRQGTVLTWDPITAENTVDVGGTTLTDLPVLNSTDALLLTAGDVVGILVAGDGATKTYAILGRLVIPGSDAAGTALDVLSRNAQAATVTTSESTTSNTFTDLTTHGPEVTVTIGKSGKLLVIVSCLLFTSTNHGSAMSFAVSGTAGSVAADFNRSWWASISSTGTAPLGGFNGSRAVLCTGLAPGGTAVVTAKYAADNAGFNAVFADREIFALAI